MAFPPCLSRSGILHSRHESPEHDEHNHQPHDEQQPEGRADVPTATSTRCANHLALLGYLASRVHGASTGMWDAGLGGGWIPYSLDPRRYTVSV